MLARTAVLVSPDIAATIMLGCPLLLPVAAAEDESEADEVLCHHCGWWFASLADLHAHAARVHELGDASIVKRCIVRPTCPACHIDLRTRIRAVQHLRIREDVRGGRNACKERGRGGRFTSST